MKELFKIIKNYKGRLLVVVLLYVLTTVLSLLMPFFMSTIVDDGITNLDMDLIIKYSVIMLAITVVSLICGLVISKVSAYTSTGVVSDMSKRIFNKINNLTSEEYNKFGAGGLLTRATDDVMVIQWSANQIVYSFVAVPIMFIGGIILTFIADYVLGIVMLVASPLLVIITVLITKKTDRYWQKSDEYIDEQNRIVRERLIGIRVIRAFDKEKYEHKRISRATEQMAKYIIKANVRAQSVAPILLLLLNLITVIIVGVSFGRVGNGAVAAGDVIAAVQYVSIASNGLLMLSWTLMMFPHLKVCLRRIDEVFAQKGVEQTTEVKEIIDGDIEINNLSYYYQDAQEPALKDISLSIKKGEVVGVIGATGSGKSTLIKLLLRFYEATEGDISLGGKKYKDVNIADIRAAYSVALQKAMIFEGTVKENIILGNPNATDEEIKEAAKIAKISDFIESQKDGYMYHLAKAGTNLSGGQKQRISISRCLIKNASVYIFDDSFSALDYLTEAKLRKDLNKKLEGKTQIIVTQRAATAMRCDKIFVIDKGQIVGKGNHKELLASCPIYKEIYDSQLGGTYEKR